MSRAILFAPLVPEGLVWALALAALLGLALGLRARLAGWPLRGLAAAALLAALANPSLQSETKRPLSDIVLVLVDESASQRLGKRPAQTEAALAAVLAELAALPMTEARVLRVTDGAKDAGTQAMGALARALAAEPPGRVAGAIVISDGQVHDLAAAPDMPAPLHLLVTGHEQDWDRRITLSAAPAFAILGEEAILSLRVEDIGPAPAVPAGMVDLSIAVDAAEPLVFTVPLGQDLDLPLRLDHAGQNVIRLSVAPVAGELTPANNAAVVAINGVRDRLRVLLVSGEPHAGERVWRNLLKSDPAVDLVHFTILRPPEKQDGIPIEELALIAFPTRELFVEKIRDFDLIIFDRYSMQGILPLDYIQNVVDYVQGGGTVLVAAGPEFGSAESLWRTPLAAILPVEPTARVISKGFRPELTDTGRRHPVTAGLAAAAPEGGWGRWFRMVEMRATAGQVLMTGPEGRPLLVLDRVGEGRVAVLASDHIWLWGRGFEGGGPQLELLRRLAHWMLKEPELEEETLSARVEGAEIAVTRRRLAPGAPGPVTVTAPDGAERKLALTETAPGLFEGRLPQGDEGLYRLAEGGLERVLALGPPSPREFDAPLASAGPLAPVLAATGGGALRLEAGMPDIRTVAAGRAAFGRGWIAITPRGATDTVDLRLVPLLPPWAGLLSAAGLLVLGWGVEGRRRRLREATGP